MKSFFFQVLYCGYKSFGQWIFTKGRNPLGRNENNNTIYSSDPAHGSDARAGSHSRPERKEVRIDSSGSLLDIDHTYGVYVNGGSQESVPYIPVGAIEFWRKFNLFSQTFSPLKHFNNFVWHLHININKTDLLVHPVIFYILLCHHQRFPGPLVIS